MVMVLDNYFGKVDRWKNLIDVDMPGSRITQDMARKSSPPLISDEEVELMKKYTLARKLP